MKKSVIRNGWFSNWKTPIFSGMALIVFAVNALGGDPLLVPIRPSVSEKAVSEWIVRYKTQDYQANRPGTYIPGLFAYKVRQPQGEGLISTTWVHSIRNSPEVAWAQPNHWRHVLASEVVPDDPYYRPDRNQRHYQQWYLPKINANFAWSIANGSDQCIVAVVDTGVDLNHPDLKERLVEGTTIVNQDGYSAPANGMDDFGHGTHVAGLIGAMSDNALGITGCSWQGKIMPVKVLNGNGEGLDSDIAEGIRWAADHGARIINLSLGGATDDNQPPQVVQEAIDAAYAKGCLIVAAAGNSGDETIHYPAALDHVLAVAATDPWDERASYSTIGTYIDVAAPGGAGGDQFNQDTGILSTYWDGNSDITDKMTGSDAGEYAVTAGTSMAAAVVSGAASVVLSHQPSLSADQLETVLKASAHDIGPAGNDEETGNGLIDLLAALGNPTVERPVLTTYNYPNPFNPKSDQATRIVYLLEQPLGVDIKIFDSARDLVWEHQVEQSRTVAGKNSVVWNGTNNHGTMVANGAYFYRIVASDGTVSRIKTIAVLR